MTIEWPLLIVALLLGFYAAWNIGANDVANAMGTSVGSRALTLRQAVILAAIFEFGGAVLFGANVSETLQTGIVAPGAFGSDPMIFVHGMMAALLATGLWLQLATHFGLPVSTTHAIVGAIVGFGVTVGGLGVVQWDHVLSIGLSWLASPILGAAFGWLIFSLVRQLILYQVSPLQATQKLLPFIVAAVALVLSLGMTYEVVFRQGSSFLKIASCALFAIFAGAATFLYTKKIRPTKRVLVPVEPEILFKLRRVKDELMSVQESLSGEALFQMQDMIQEVDNFALAMERNLFSNSKNSEMVLVEKIFGYLQISSACLMAFAHGSNDVANAIGPMAAVISGVLHQPITPEAFPLWALILGGVGIVVGLATWGWKVIDTIGKHITELTPTRGFSAEFGAALIILLASRFGFPISTTHTIVGAVFGVGFARGLSTLNLKIVRDILLSWFVTIPIAAVLSFVCFWAIHSLF